MEKDPKITNGHRLDTPDIQFFGRVMKSIPIDPRLITAGPQIGISIITPQGLKYKVRCLAAMYSSEDSIKPDGEED